MPEPLLSLKSVSKRYGPTVALSDVSFAVRAGEVHVLAGGNGAGKSTLIKILSGAVTDYDGELLLEGRRSSFRDPRAAARAGVATLFQELSLVPSLSVRDNLFLGEPRPLLSLWHAGSEREVLGKVGLDLDPSRLVEELGLAERQLVELARALQHAARVLILDEPTSALAEPEAERLFSRVRELAAEGKGIVFITHRLDEIFRLADHITVLRDGRVVASEPAPAFDERTLVEKMLGVALEDLEHAPEREHHSEVVLSASSFELHAGEILGVAGLQDSGASELLRELCGASPRDALRRGVSLLPRDRAESVFQHRPIAENVTLGSLPRVSRLGFVSSSLERELAGRLSRRMGLVAASLDQPAGTLSGGNQQKVALARCLASEPRVLLLDDPTRGVDVAAKADVHRLVRELASAGTGVVLVSSDFDELLRLADRILVLFRGKPAALLPRSALNRESLLGLAMGAA